MIATITSKGQITLPASVRKELKIGTGDKLDIEVTPDGEILGRPVKNDLSTLADVLPPTKRRLSLAEMDAAIRKGVSRQQ